METPALSHRIVPLLRKGETLEWVGQPRQGIRFRREDWFQIPITFVFLGAVLYWESIALFYTLADGARFPHLQPFYLLFSLYGMVFVVIGLYASIGRFFWDSYSRAHTTYAITNRRLIMYRDGIRPKTQSLDTASLRNLQREVRREGYGTLSIGLSSRKTALPLFDDIPGVQAVYELIQANRG